MARLLVALNLLVPSIALLATTPALADEKLWSLLKAGGQVVLIRHTVTTPGAGDPPGMRLDDCTTQRNLTDAGRAHARRIGEAIPIARHPGRAGAVEPVVPLPGDRATRFRQGRGI